jgi:hypothetical protein
MASTLRIRTFLTLDDDVWRSTYTYLMKTKTIDVRTAHDHHHLG